jgi:hypothetical protein
MRVLVSPTFKKTTHAACLQRGPKPPGERDGKAPEGKTEKERRAKNASKTRARNPQVGKRIDSEGKAKKRLGARQCAAALGNVIDGGYWIALPGSNVNHEIDKKTPGDWLTYAEPDRGSPQC